MSSSAWVIAKWRWFTDMLTSLQCSLHWVCTSHKLRIEWKHAKLVQFTWHSHDKANYEQKHLLLTMQKQESIWNWNYESLNRPSLPLNSIKKVVKYMRAVRDVRVFEFDDEFGLKFCFKLNIKQKRHENQTTIICMKFEIHWNDALN